MAVNDICSNIDDTVKSPLRTGSSHKKVYSMVPGWCEFYFKITILIFFTNWYLPMNATDRFVINNTINWAMIHSQPQNQFLLKSILAHLLLVSISKMCYKILMRFLACKYIFGNCKIIVIIHDFINTQNFTEMLNLLASLRNKSFLFWEMISNMSITASKL